MKKRVWLLLSMLLLLAAACCLASCGNAQCIMGHTCEEWSVLVEATCAAEGEQVGNCTVCGESVREKIPKNKNHTPGEEQLIGSNKIRRCLVCDEIVESVALEDVNGFKNDNLPSDLNFEGEEVRVLYWSDAENPEFEQETTTGDNVRDAIFDRNNQIEERLNVDLKWYGQPGNGGNISAFVKHLENVYNTNVQMYDIVASYSRTTGLAAIQGYLYNLNTITKDNYLDFDMPWWPQSMNEAFSFGDAQYFMTGDISTNTMYMMHLMFYNKDLFTRFELNDPCELVYRGKWTMDKMIEITSDCYQDLDRDNAVSDNDMYGLVGLDYVAASLYTSANLRYIEKSAQDMLIISPDFGSAKAARLLNKLGDWVAQDAVRIHNGSIEPIQSRSNVIGAFRNGRALMMIGFAVNAKSYSSQDFELGLVPTPKYDEAQVNYYTGMGNPYTLYGVFVDFEDRGDKAATLSMFTAVLECWASEGYRLITPKIYENILQQKYSAGEDKSNMFEYVRAGITFDLGQVFASYLGAVNERPAKAFCENVTWVEVYPQLEYTVSKQLEQLVENFRTYQAERDMGM